MLRPELRNLLGMEKMAQAAQTRPAKNVDGDAWSESAWAPSIDLIEHSRMVGPSAVLTFLWHRYG